MSESVKAYLDKFKGLRKTNPISEPLSGVMSAMSISNTELKYSGNSDAVGIYSMLGNTIVASLTNEAEKIYGMWESYQEGTLYWIIYTSDGIKGRLYHYDKSLNTFTLIYDVLTATIYSNAITVSQGFYDYLFFTNGIDAPLAIRMAEIVPEDIVTVISAIDYEGRDIRGLALESYDNRVVMTSGNRVHWSRQGDIFDWATIESLETDSAYQEFDREITAIAYYNNSLIVFTDDYSVSFSGNPAVTTSFNRSGATGGGCASYLSIIKFDNKLYYYDRASKNIFAYYLYDSGQIRPSDGVASNIFEEFNDVDNTRIKETQFFPVLVENRNEIWFKVPVKGGLNKVLILNYTLGEWVARTEQKITKVMIYNDELYSCFDNHILKEYNGENYGNEFIPSHYEFNVINLGSDATLKSCKGRIFFTLDTTDEDGDDIENDFYIQFIRDGNEMRSKIKRISKKIPDDTLIWVNDDEDLSGGYWVEDDEDKRGNVWLRISRYDQLLKLPPIAPFKQLKIKIFTAFAGQRFAIKRIEFAKINVKRAK